MDCENITSVRFVVDVVLNYPSHDATIYFEKGGRKVIYKIQQSFIKIVLQIHFGSVKLTLNAPKHKFNIRDKNIRSCHSIVK